MDAKNVPGETTAKQAHSLNFILISRTRLTRGLGVTADDLDPAGLRLTTIGKATVLLTSIVSR